MLDSSEILKRRQFVSMALQSPFWAMINAFSFIVFILESKFSLISWVPILSPSLWIHLKEPISWAELILALLFLINSIYNLYIFIKFKRLMSPLELTPNEAQLFGVRPGEPGFLIREKLPPPPSPSTKTSEEFDLSFFIPSTFSTPSKHSSLDSTALSSRFFHNSSNMSDVKATSWSYLRRNAQDERLSPLNNSSSFSNIIDSKKNDSLLRLRRRSNSFFLRKTETGNGNISFNSKEELERYLLEQERKDEELQELLQSQKRYETITNIPDKSPQMFGGQYFPPSPASMNVMDPSGSPIFTNSCGGGGSPMMAPVATKNLSFFTGNGDSPQTATTSVPYMPAIKTASTPSSQEKTESLNSSTKAVEKILAKLGVDDARLNQMVENIRKWISQTILVRLVKEIDLINKLIREKGYIDSLVGETSIKQLKYLAQHKKEEFPTLEQVIPFLEIATTGTRNIEHHNIAFQQYLIRRIKDLAKGGCMIEFLWDGGGSYNYRPWNDSTMITDSELIFHVFCVYMDSRLLFNPAAPEGKPFTSQYFKPYGGPEPKSDTYIQQDKPYPPQYSLMLKGEHFDIPGGRNNLFHTLLVFLHHIKVKNFGLLGRINLGPSGLNISWVIEK